MKIKTLQKIYSSVSASAAMLLLSAANVIAQENFDGLSNPVLKGELETNPDAANSGDLFATFFLNLWSAFMAIGAIFVLVLFIWGALEWIASGGDKGKIENARNRITQAVIGLVILVGSFVILGFLSQLLFGDSFDILRINIPNILK